MTIGEQVAIVTGAGSGLGRAMAMGLAREGAKVMLADVRQEGALKVRQEIETFGGTAETFAGDLSQEFVAQQLIDFCAHKFGRIDILINNAGLRMEVHEDGLYEDWRCLKQRPTHEVPVSDWDLLIGVNLRAVYLCTHFVLPHMIKQRHGVIIGISSNAGHEGVAGKCAYVASKHAIHPGGRVNVDGRGGQSPDVVVPLVLFLAGQDQPTITGKVIKAKDWNAEQRDF
jgi:NAD(P)-dependent dehydrogenase (short-subunit alcohol dehydrogenase family)